MKVPQKIKIWILSVAWYGDENTSFHKAFLNKYKAKEEIRILKNDSLYNRYELEEHILIE